MSRKLPRLFVASSVERLSVANAVQELLEFDAEVTVWNQGIVRPTQFTLPELYRTARNTEFAAFVVAPDDVLAVRDAVVHAARDNVVFELGMFIGALTLESCFLIVPRTGEPVRLPSDLLGLTPLTYATNRADNNLLAALGPACNRVRRAIADSRPSLEMAFDSKVPQMDLTYRRKFSQDYVQEWDSPALQAARKAVRSIPLDPHSDEFANSARPALRKLFSFLEGVADATLARRVDEDNMRRTFDHPVKVLWPHMYTLLAPPNQADEWWSPKPKLAELFARWNELKHGKP